MEIQIARHRAARPSDTSAAPLSFMPRHCAGDGCTHNHTGASTGLRGVVKTLQGWTRKKAAA